jgi:hypothetical protein
MELIPIDAGSSERQAQRDAPTVSDRLESRIRVYIIFRFALDFSIIFPFELRYFIRNLHGDR